MSNKEYPFNVIPLFPEKMDGDPLESPLVKAFLDDISAHTEIHAAAEVDEGIVLVWSVGTVEISLTLNLRTEIAWIEVVKNNTLELLSGFVSMTPEKSNRWIGYLIDDLS